jgi:hypothetical protein
VTAGHRKRGGAKAPGKVAPIVLKKNRNPIATKAVADQVSRLTMKYCQEKPSDDLSSVVGMWTEVVVKSLK